MQDYYSCQASDGMADCCPRAVIGDAAAEFANHFDEIAASHVIR
jgi:hypothetical protein